MPRPVESGRSAEGSRRADQTHAKGRGVMRTEATVFAITHPSFVLDGARTDAEPVDDTTDPWPLDAGEPADHRCDVTDPIPEVAAARTDERSCGSDPWRRVGRRR